MNRFAAGALAAMFTAGLAGAVATHGRESSGRADLHRFFSRFHLDVRRPLDVEAAALSPSWDWAAEIAAEVTLSDAFDTKSLSGMSPAERNLWLEAASSTGDELRESEGLLLSAIAARPGWAYHRYLFGKVYYGRLVRDGDPDVVRRPERWALPLRTALSDAPGETVIADFLGGVYLETWRVVSPDARPDARAVLRQAFGGPDFVSRGFLTAVLLLGRREADALLPDDPAVLSQAIGAYATQHDAAAAFELVPRSRAAERLSRKADLSLAEERRDRNDFAGLVVACSSWASRHPVEDFDDADDRKIAARLLEIWPADSPGAWPSDGRARFITFFLSGARPEAAGAVLERAASALSGLPDSIRARVLLRAGELGQALDLAGHATSRGSFEWTPFLVELAREELRHGDVPGAARAVDSIAVGALGQCDALLLRRDLARALDRPPDPDLVRSLATIGRATFFPEEWSRDNSISLCLDPAGSAGRSLRAGLKLTRPAGTPPPAITREASLVEFGWDGGWETPALLDFPSGTVRSPIAGLSGRHVFHVRVRAGDDVVPTASGIELGP